MNNNYGASKFSQYQKLNRWRENKSPAEENDPNSGMKYYKTSSRLAQKKGD